MRDMANPSNIEFAAQNRRRNRMILRIRPAVQTAFLLLWAAPLTWISERLGQIGRSIPSCVFHCYYAGGGVCPAASLSCPVGIVAQFCAVGITPMLAIGIVLLCGSLAGSLACGWACPFGFFQDLLAKIPLPKFRIPAWMGYGRYAVLIVLVIALPYAMGLCGVAYDDQSATTICAWCPAGAVEAGLPGVVSAVARGDIHAAANGLVQADGRTLLGWKKVGIIAAFLVASMLTFRPWCTVLCPLGGGPEPVQPRQRPAPAIPSSGLHAVQHLPQPLCVWRRGGPGGQLPPLLALHGMHDLRRHRPHARRTRQRSYGVGSGA